MAKIPDRRSAQVGEIFFVSAGHLTRALLGSDEPGCCEVMPKTEGAATNGQWICISCCVPLSNNFEKDTHCNERAPRKSALVGPHRAPQAKHVLAWRSFESGKIEAP